jgi:hypothetical protein
MLGGELLQLLEQIRDALRDIRLLHGRKSGGG